MISLLIIMLKHYITKKLQNIKIQTFKTSNLVNFCNEIPTSNTTTCYITAEHMIYKFEHIGSVNIIKYKFISMQLLFY